MRHFKPCLLITCLLGSLAGIQANAQQDYSYANLSTTKNYNAYQQEKKLVLMDALKELNKIKGVYFLFSDQSIGHQQVNTVTNYKKDIEKILDDILKGSGLTYKKVSDNTYVILTVKEKKQKQSIQPQNIQFNFAEPQHRIEKADLVRGRITASDGSPLYGVSITVKGTNRGTTTNANGDFSLEINNGETVVISYVGYEPQEFVVNNNKDLSIVLQPANRQISEVVVTALGIRRESKRLGYSITKVSGDEFTQSREINLGNALTGKIAGVSSSGPLTGPGGSSRVLIRGTNSLTGDNQPLYVVNGIPMNNSNLGSAGKWGGADLGDGLASINPDDIEEISVLKGGAAAALYGQIAKNGVILITTKSGRGKKGLGIELNSNIQVDRINNFLEFQDQYGQGTLGQKPTAASAMASGMQSWGARLDGSSVPVFNGQSMPYSSQGDNLKRFYETGATFTNTLAIASGNEAGNFRLSFGDLRNNSVYPNSRYIRNSVNLDLNYKLASKLSGQATVIYSKEVGKNRANLSDAPGNGNYGILLLPPNVNADYLRPGFNEAGSELQFSSDAFTTNPYFAANKFQNNTNKNRILGVASLRFNPLDWMYVQARIGNDYFAFNATQITPTGTAYRPGGSLDNEVDRFFNEINTDVLVGANKNLTNDISFGLTIGANLLQRRERINTINASGLAFPFVYNPGGASVRGANTATPRKDVRSIYGSLELGYKNFFFLNVTDRNDWSSTIPIDNNSYNYPSVNASYIFSEHLKISWLSFGKLRAGYSQVGADADPYKTALYYTTNGSISGHPLGNLGNTIPNSQLEPLQIKELEIGTQLGLFKNRLTIDMAWYKKQTLNDIVEGTVSLTSGYNNAVVNVGKIENKGFELLLSGSPISGKDFKWNSSFNFSRNNNKVIELAEGQTFMSMSENRTERGFIHHRIGLPASQVMVYDFKRDAKGALVLNASGFPQSSDGLVSAGTSIHPTYGGWNNTFNYKKFGLDFLVDYKFGGVLYSGTNARAYAAGLHKETLNGREGGVKVEGVSESGTAMSQTLTAQQYYGALANISMVQNYNADFIKMRSLALSYTIPASVFKNKVQGATVSLVGRNLFYFKRDTPNIDPEANYSNGFSHGLEYASLPSTRTYGLNLNVKF